MFFPLFPSPTSPNRVAATSLLAIGALLALNACSEKQDTPAPAPIAVTADAVVPEKLTGTAFGTSPAYNPGYEFGKAFDGSLTTFFDAAPGSGGYVGLELPAGQSKKVVQIRFASREWLGSRMVGGKFQGSSTSATSGYADLHTITSAPGNGWQTISVNNSNAYRWLRYVGPDGSHCNIAELEFYTEGTTTTPTPTDAVSGPPAGTGSWTKSFEDNFDSFDAGKWTKGWPCGNGNDALCTYGDPGVRQKTYYSPDNVYMADGKLHIRTERKAQGGQAFTSGAITTAGKTTSRFQQKYGYFEVRMKPASSPGNDPDFWAFPLSKQAVDANGNPGQYKELDFAEFGGRGGVVAMTSHMPFKPNQSFSKTGDWTSDFHTYGVLWEASKATLYIDGVEQGSITRDIVDEQGVLILSDEVDDDNGSWFGDNAGFTGPIVTQVDWVRVWRKN
ncbi:glycoside hydrolase family 16 protein [Hymenobacter weizhouensis]|uniref:glycoside hydrolase family 16 protein n=1 Tax=Hymenobacter sp. YIM 151500-1 TaxID=2987689 RepID=UPI0022279132|nr:glycoside hydrolase family 16 protein [Hymenobacter sp. YIM 151500-1]UYZ61735.1 glycoside hydrolase family 16 protein [Hymenobacter sp. YIM 151500-1]